MERQRVINLASDAAVGKVLAELVAARNADNVLVEDVSGARIGEGQHDPFGGAVSRKACAAEEMVITLGEIAALLVPVRKIPELYFEDRGLNRVEARVPANLVVEVAPL